LRCAGAFTLASLGAASGSAAELPAALAPPAPFPLVIGSSVEREPVAPGVGRATYRLLTSAGPLVVSVVTVDPREPTVRLGAVLAHDTIVSKDETVSAMARRTGAVAGINGDYFDIGNTGAPVGVLIRGGTLDRSPSARVALTVTRDRGVRFEPYGFGGFVEFGATRVPLTAVNTWPPEGGVTMLTAAFGIPPAAGGVTVLSLAPFGADPALRRYRVTAVQDAPPFPAGPALRLAYGAGAQAFGPLPDVGDVLSLAYDTDPPLGLVAAAIGGGPLLLRGGVPVDDPASPNYADRARRIPAAAAARFADGSLALVVVDGRHPATSIGVNRAELIALLAALGATDAMLFDSGGSATLAARVLGDTAASVVNEPSDGVERPVADGLFVYSDAPLGPPDRLVVRPSRIVAVGGAHVPLQARLVDAAGHGLGEARGAWRLDAPPQVATIDPDDVLHAGARAGAQTLHLARGGVAAALPFEIVDRVARLEIGPARADPDPHATIQLSADAFDGRDRPVAVAGTVRWSATGATIDAHGRLTAGDADAQVTATAGGIATTVRIPVGRHDVPLALFDDAHAGSWTLSTLPANGPGSVAVDAGRLAIGYDLRAERAAYATSANDVPLGDPVALACAFDGDGSGAALRATLIDRYGDRQTIAFAHALDAAQTRHVSATVPRALAPPIALHAFSVLATATAASATGTIGVHDCTASLPGTQTP
jgi:Phosphodiester glycosidase